MKLQETKCNKFSIVLAMAMIFLALPAIAAAQGGGTVTCGFGYAALTVGGVNNTFTGGIFVATGDVNSSALTQRSRVTSLTVTFNGSHGVVNSCDADAASRARTLFEARKILGLTDPVVIEIPHNNTPEWFQTRNYLQRAQVAGTRIPVMELLIADNQNPQQYFKIEMKDVLVTNWQTSAASGGGRPTEMLTLNFTEIKY